MCASCPAVDRPELDAQIFACLVGRGSPAQLPEEIRNWAYQLYEEPPVEGSGPHAIIKAALDDLQTAVDPVRWMLDLSFLFSCEWLIDYSRDWGAPSATYLDEFDEWVTLYRCPGCMPDARYLLYQMAAALLFVAGEKVGNHEAIHPYFLNAGQPRHPDIGARIYRSARILGYSHKAAKGQVMGFADDVLKEERGELRSTNRLRGYPKERALPRF